MGQYEFDRNIIILNINTQKRHIEFTGLVKFYQILPGLISFLPRHTQQLRSERDLHSPIANHLPESMGGRGGHTSLSHVRVDR